MESVTNPSCVKCGNDFPVERYDLGYKDCVSCSTVKKDLVLMDYGHKTAGYAVRIPFNDLEGQRRAKRVYKRSR